MAGSGLAMCSTCDLPLSRSSYPSGVGKTCDCGEVRPPQPSEFYVTVEWLKRNAARVGEEEWMRTTKVDIHMGKPFPWVPVLKFF